MRRMNSLVILILIATLLMVVPAWAQEGDGEITDDDVNAIAKQLFCPVCENIPLDVCPTQACEQWRGVIRDMLAEGHTEQEIKDYFVAQYGDRVLGTPPARGLNWVVYVFPPLAFVVGAVLLFYAIRKWKVDPSTADDALPDDLAEDPYVARIEEELRQRNR